MESTYKNSLQEDFASFVLQNGEEGVVGFDRQLKCTQWNPAMERLSGLRKEYCLGKLIPEILPFLIKTGEIAYYWKTLEGESSRLENQLFFIPEKGCYGHYTAKYLPLYNAATEITGGVALFQDTSKYFSVLQALEEAEEKYAGLVNNSPEAIVVFSAEEVLFANPKMLKILGLNHPFEIIGKDPLSFVAEQHRGAAYESIKAILSNQLQEPVKYSLIRKDGVEIYTEITYLSMQYIGKHAIQAIIRDVTVEKKSFTELVNHKQMLHEALVIARLGSYRLNVEDGSSFWTDGLYRIFEAQPDSIEPSLETYLEFSEEPAREVLYGLLQRLIKGELKEASHIHKVKIPNGKEKHVKIVGKPKLNEEGKVSFIIGTVQDITETKKVEEELFRANQILNLHLEKSPLGIIQLNSELKITGWSKQMESIFGWKAEEVNGSHISSWKFFNEECQETFLNINQKNSSSYFNKKQNNLLLYTRNNTKVYCDIFMTGISGENGNLHSVLILLNDVTSQQLSEQARQEGQLEERKRIAREIHDGIGQMLIAVKYKLASLEDCLQEEDFLKVQNLEGMIEQTLEEVRSVSRNLAPRSVATMGLETSLRQMCDQIKKLTAIDISFRYIGGGQEVNNKIVNALYRIAQEATNNIIKHAQATIASVQVFQGRNFIELKVEDNGKGISATGSNGMGMKNIEERAKLLGGRFQVHSEQDFGTNLIINIPLDQQDNI